jgi:DNA-binding NtrC family response regulator
VLLVGSDRRFRSVTAALLQRRGYSVTIGEQMASMAEVAAREHVDVVVLDTGALPALAALEAAKLEALNPSVGMIFVSDGLGQALPATPVLPKWGSFDGLYDAIEVVRAAKPQSGRS